MTKKILLFSRDPGGANTIIPLVGPLEKKGYVIKLFGKDVALDMYAQSCLSAFNIIDYIKNTNLNCITDFLKKEGPDFIITSTSGDDFTEKYLWAAGEKLGIPSFAIVDQWINYGIRFSKHKITEIREYNKNKKHQYLPTKILIMDDYAKQEAINEGLESSMLIATGQPHFETLLKYKEIKSTELISNRDKLNINGSDFFITFASEPISKDYGIAVNYMGYTEQTVLRDILENLEKISLEYGGNIYLTIKLHPRDNVEAYENIVLSKYEKINIRIDENSNPLDLILASDLICGMSSMFLIESVILGKPVISVQIGLNKENPFILDRRGILESILDKKLLLNQLRSLIIENEIPHYNFDIIKTPVDNIIYQMEKYLCQS